MQREDSDPREHQQQAERAAETERREADEAREEYVGEQQYELGDGENDPVLRMPLDIGILFFHQQRNQRKHPQIREHDHDAAVRRNAGFRHARRVYDILEDMQVDQSRVLDALKVVRDPDLNRDIVSLGFVKDLRVESGRVAFTIELTTPACPVKDQMRDQARAAVLEVPGVTAVDVTMSARVREAVGADGPRQALQGVKNVIAVGAGKGGVGKTTVAVNLAIALAKCGSKVGIIDGDIYGPNVPIMLGMKGQLVTDGQKIVPAEKFGLQVISMGFLTQDDAPIIWRGPMLHGALQQFFREVRWVDLDYLVIDLPPGTGDVALSLSQTVPVAGAIVVTTPQQVSLADSRRAVAMYKKLNIPPLGIVENMSYYVCPNCAHEADIFGHGGGEKMAADLGVPFVGRIPIYQPIREGSDTGVPLIVSEPDSPAARAFMAAAERTAAQVSIASYNRPTIPLTVVR
jgi:ATP-binding protein involved in chromosome partitioning